MCVWPAQEETDRLIAKLETLANAADWNVQMIQEASMQKQKQLELHIQSDHKRFSCYYGRKQLTAACLFNRLTADLCYIEFSLGADRLEKEAGQKQVSLQQKSTTSTIHKQQQLVFTPTLLLITQAAKSSKVTKHGCETGLTSS
jgi:hypothetical protein